MESRVQTTTVQFADNRKRMGALGVTELSTLIGYYTLLAFNANAFEIDVPEGGTESRLPI